MTPERPLLGRLEYPECMEVRRLLGYLWTATGKNPLRPVSDLFDSDDPLVADVERLAVFPDGEAVR